MLPIPTGRAWDMRILCHPRVKQRFQVHSSAAVISNLALFCITNFIYQSGTKNQAYSFRTLFKNMLRLAFLGGRGHLHAWLCVCLSVWIIQTWVRGYSTKFTRRNGCRGLKFSLHIKIGLTRCKMVKNNVSPPKKNLGGVQNWLS